MSYQRHLDSAGLNTLHKIATWKVSWVFQQKQQKLTYGRPNIDKRVALLYTRYLTAMEIIPESLNSLGQFWHAKINEKDLMDVRTDRLTLNVKKNFVFKNVWCVSNGKVINKGKDVKGNKSESSVLLVDIKLHYYYWRTYR